jgi:hypothetical protein
MVEEERREIREVGFLYDLDLERNFECIDFSVILRRKYKILR